MNYEVIRKGVDTGHHLFYVFFFFNLKFNSYNEEEEIQTTDASIKNTKRCQPIDALYITYFMLKFNQDQIRNNNHVS